MGAPIPFPLDAVPVAADDQAIFQARLLPTLRAVLGEDIYSSWFGRLRLDKIEEGVAHLSVPTRFLRSWIESHYLDRLTSIAVDVLPSVKRLSIGIRTTDARLPIARPSLSVVAKNMDRAPTRSSPSEPSQSVAAPRVVSGSEVSIGGFVGSPLDRRYSFETFHVGRSNQLAHAAAERVARAIDERPIYNPFFVHGCTGLGKTHLMQAIGNASLSTARRVIYMTAEKFMYGFAVALKGQQESDFREKLRSVDLLLIDDVQFLQGKSIQREFMFAVNTLIEARKQIVLAADRPPADLESLEERLRSRLSGGLTLEIAPLDEALRIKMLESRVAAAQASMPGFDVSAAVIAFVASVIQTNGRDLDGAVNRLMAHASLTQAPLTVETAETAIRDLVRMREPKRVKIEDIQKLIATHYNTSRADILSSRRTANVVRPRQIAMYLSKVLTLRSLPEIGRRFGGRDHTTVLHAVRKIEGLIVHDKALDEDLKTIRAILEDG